MNENYDTKLVYICHPIGGSVMDNIEMIARICRRINLNSDNVIPFAPYISDVIALDDDIVRERSIGIRNALEIITRKIPDEIWVYGLKLTPGMIDEIKTAIKNDIPVLPKNNKVAEALHQFYKINES